jgi:hypothetical protein
MFNLLPMLGLLLQGWDDIGLHNPEYVNTPNLDRYVPLRHDITLEPR